MKLTTTIDVALGRGQNMREHYAVRAKRVKAEREATKAALWCQSKMQPWALDEHTTHGARITLHRPWARVALDSDNLSGAFKGVRDEVASFLGVDDKSERLHWIYTQSKQPKGTFPTVTIEVMPVQDIDPQVKRVRELEAEVVSLRSLLDEQRKWFRKTVDDEIEAELSFWKNGVNDARRALVDQAKGYELTMSILRDRVNQLEGSLKQALLTSSK